MLPLSAKNPRTPKTLRYNSHQKLRSHKRIDSIDDLKTFVPDWLTGNKDFVTSYKKMKHQVDIDLCYVCQRSHNSRTKDEKKALYSWIKTKQYFSSMHKEILKKVCDKLSFAHFSPGEASNI